MAYSKRYYRAIGSAELILEGKGIRESGEEIGVSRNTIRKDVQYLLNYAKTKEHRIIAEKAYIALQKKNTKKDM